MSSFILCAIHTNLPSSQATHCITDLPSKQLPHVSIQQVNSINFALVVTRSQLFHIACLMSVRSLHVVAGHHQLYKDYPSDMHIGELPDEEGDISDEAASVVNEADVDALVQRWHLMYLNGLQVSLQKRLLCFYYIQLPV